MDFTAQTVEEAALPPKGKQAWLKDPALPGLAILVLPTGVRTWYYTRKIAGRLVRTRIGAWPEVPIAQARKLARKVQAEQEAGRAFLPKAPAPKRLLLSEVFAWWLEAHAKRRKRSWAQDLGTWRLYLEPELGQLPAADLGKAVLREAHAGWGEQRGRYGANRALALLRAVLNRAISDGLVPGPNPAEGVEPWPEESRDRRLQGDELKRLLDALEARGKEGVPGRDFADLVLLALMTGARQGNLLAMRWADVDLIAQIWRIPAAAAKGKRPIEVPLLEAELAILQRRLEGCQNGCEWVFPASKGDGHRVQSHKAWKVFLAQAGLEDLRMHDLRRTMGSLMADAGVSLPVIGKALGHHSTAATQVYARVSLGPVREAKARALGWQEAKRNPQR